MLGQGWPHTPAGRAALTELDAWLRADGHGRNPGTTADLVTACLFVALRQGIIELPPRFPWSAGRQSWLSATRSASPRTTWSSAPGTSSATKATSANGCTATTTAPPSRSRAPLDENHYVFDFIALKHRTKAITDELDHRMMLPTRNPLIRVEEGPRSVHVRYRDREWLFPRDDCVLLPIENTTAELLARYIGQRLLEDLRRQHGFEPEVLRVEVEESIGQSATCEWRTG